MKSKVVSHLWIIAVKIIAFPLRWSREQQNTQQFIALLRCRLFGSEPVARCSERKPLISAEFHIKDEPAVSPLVHRPRNQQERLQDSIFRYPSPLSQLHFLTAVSLIRFSWNLTIPISPFNFCSFSKSVLKLWDRCGFRTNISLFQRKHNLGWCFVYSAMNAFSLWFYMLLPLHVWLYTTEERQTIQ